MNQKMTPEAQRVMEKMMGKLGGTQTTPDGLPIIGGEEGPSITDIFAMQLRQMEMQIAHLMKGYQIVGTSSDLSRLNLQMLMKLLVDKEFISQEDMETLFKEEVIEELERMEKEARAAAEEEFKKIQEAAEQATANAKVEGEERLSELTTKQEDPPPPLVEVKEEEAVDETKEEETTDKED